MKMKSIYALIVLLVIIILTLIYLLTRDKIKRKNSLVSKVIPLVLISLLVIFSIIVWKQKPEVNTKNTPQDNCNFSTNLQTR